MRGRVTIRDVAEHAVSLDFRDDAAPVFEFEPGAVVVHCRREGRLVSHVSYIDPADGPYPFFDGAGAIVT